MRKIIIFICFVFSFSLFSCASDSFIPGAKTIAVNNIYQEYMNIGNIYTDLNKYDKALDFYTRASESRKLYWACLYKIADANFRLGKWAEAENGFKILLKRDSENLQLQESLAYVYASQGKYEEALDLYSELEKKYPENQSFLENYIVILLSQENAEQARLKLDNLKKLFPDNKKIDSFEQKLLVLETPADSNEPDSESADLEDGAVKTETGDSESSEESPVTDTVETISEN